MAALPAAISAEQSKEAFLDAAERLFISPGYRASSMETIAREAGYSRGSIYRHFPTRDSLVEALIQRITQRHMAESSIGCPRMPVPLTSWSRAR